MSGFDPSELLPFYLDETDEQIATLNDALLRFLRRPPPTSPRLQEAFRMFHSIKGAAVVMGFEPVSRLEAHHLESLYEQVRSQKRTLDRARLDLSFRCLDELRDYHRNLRAEGSGGGDLSTPHLPGCLVPRLHNIGRPRPLRRRTSSPPPSPAPEEPPRPSPSPEPEAEPEPEPEQKPVAAADFLVDRVLPPRLPRRG